MENSIFECSLIHVCPRYSRNQSIKSGSITALKNAYLWSANQSVLFQFSQFLCWFSFGLQLFSVDEDFYVQALIFLRKSWFLQTFFHRIKLLNIQFFSSILSSHHQCKMNNTPTRMQKRMRILWIELINTTATYKCNIYH